MANEVPFSPDNNEQPYYQPAEIDTKRTLCCFVLDRSGSMSENNRIVELNSAVNSMINEIRNDAQLATQLEIAVIGYDNYVDVIQDCSLVADIDYTVDLTPRGSTKLVDAVFKATEIVEKRKTWYDQQNLDRTRPFIVLITDGEPDGDQDIAKLAKANEENTKRGSYYFLSLGVEGANMDVLNQIAGYVEEEGEDKKGMFCKVEPKYTKSTNLNKFFKFLVNSVKVAEQQEKPLTPADLNADF